MATYRIKRFSSQQKLFMLTNVDPSQMVKVNVNGEMRAMRAGRAYERGYITAEQASRYGINGLQDLKAPEMFASGGGASLSGDGTIVTKSQGGQVSKYGEKVGMNQNFQKNVQQNNQQFIQQQQANQNWRNTVKQSPDLQQRISQVAKDSRKAGYNAGKNSVTLMDSLKKTASTTKGKLGLIGAGVATLGAGAMLGRATAGGGNNQQ